jgi:hypothetical protein
MSWSKLFLGLRDCKRETLHNRELRKPKAGVPVAVAAAVAAVAAAAAVAAVAAAATVAAVSAAVTRLPEVVLKLCKLAAR